MAQQCTARLPNGTCDDPEAYGCESCVAWQEERWEAMERADAEAEQAFEY